MKQLFNYCMMGMLLISSSLCADSRTTREILIDTNVTLYRSLCNPIFITQADVGTTGTILNGPGVYKLAENIPFSPASTAAAITINSSNVELDLQCFIVSQANAQAAVTGISIASGLSNIIIENGTVSGFTGNGINAADGLTYVTIDSVSLKNNGGYGLQWNGTGTSQNNRYVINNCRFETNSLGGMQANFTNAGSILNSMLTTNSLLGIDLESSYTTNIQNCIIRNTLSSNSDVFGIALNGGGYNSIQNCKINGVTTSATGTNNKAVGIYCGPTEHNDDIANNSITNVISTLSTSTAFAVGIDLDYTFSNLDGMVFDNSQSDPTLRNDLCCAWSPNGRYLATGAINSANNVRVAEFNSAAIADGEIMTTGVASYFGNNTVWNLAWSPDGSYLLVSGQGKPYQIFSFDGNALTLVASAAGTNNGFACAWSPDGRFFAWSDDTANNFNISQFNGNNNTVTDIQTGISPNGLPIASMSWSPFGNYIAVGTINGAADWIYVYQVQGAFSGGTVFITSAPALNANAIFGLRWSPNGRFLAASAIGSNAGFRLGVYSFDGMTLGSPIAEVDDTQLALNSVQLGSWSPDGNYLSVSDGASGSLMAFRFEYTSLVLTPTQTYFPGSSNPNSDWSPMGDYLAYVGCDTVACGGTGNTPVWIAKPLLFGTGSTVTNNTVSKVTTAINYAPGVARGVGVMGSSFSNFIGNNSTYNNNLDLTFVAFERYQEFLTNISVRNQFPNRLSNVIVPPL